MSTQRFGLENDGITTGKFATVDRDLIDRVLAFLETHDHSGGATPAPLADPVGAPTGVLDTTGGALDNGQVLYYRVAYIDEFGLETAGSDELVVALPDTPLATEAPNPVGNTVSGSTLAADTYYYAVTVTSPAGESPLGPAAIITLVETQNQVDVELPLLPTGGTGFNVWRQALADAGWSRIGTGVTGSTFADTGFPREPYSADPSTQPPDLLQPAGDNAVTVTVPGGSIPAGVARWRLYRTDSAGIYGLTSLVAEVVDPGDGLPIDYVDVGAAELAGTPLETSTTLTPSKQVAGAGGGGGGGGASLAPSTSYLRFTQRPNDNADTRFADPSYALTVNPKRDGYAVTNANSDIADGGNAYAGYVAHTAGAYLVRYMVEVTELSPGDVVRLFLNDDEGDLGVTAVCGPGRNTVQLSLEGPLYVRNAGESFGAQANVQALWSATSFTPRISEWTIHARKVWGGDDISQLLAAPSGISITDGGSTPLVIGWFGLPGALEYRVTLYAGGQPFGFWTATNSRTLTSSDIVLGDGLQISVSVATRNAYGYGPESDFIPYTIPSGSGGGGIS